MYFIDLDAEDGTAVDCMAADGTPARRRAELSKQSGRYSGIA